MKRQYNIDNIRQLLEAYYNGDTSIEQEQLLCDFFATATDIPSDMEADRQLFQALSTDIDNIDIPNDLENRLSTHIDNLDFAEKRIHRNWIKPFTIISVAASLIILFAIGFNLLSFDKQINSTSIELITAINKDSIEIEEQTDSIPSKKSHIELLANEEKSIPSAAQKKKRVKKYRTVRTNQLKSVSDEQIAYENTEMALMLLSEKLKIAQEGVKQTENTIHEVNNTITDII